jgi:hypothetical protein
MRQCGWVLLCIVVACGGKAVIDADGSGGAGSTSNGPGAGSMNGPTTDVVSTTSTSMTSLCDEACASISACLASDVQCVTGCLDNEGCEVERDAFLECYLQDTTPELCTMPTNCEPALLDLLACDGSSIGSVGCSGGMGMGCGCFVSGSSGRQFETSCMGASGTAQCECFVDGDSVGRCVHPGPPMEACDPFIGCCAGLMFIP